MKHIIGHKNPDTDSVCSAVAYQDFLAKKNIEAKAFRLGDLNKETKLVFEKFGVEPPEKISGLSKNSEVVLVDHNEEKQAIDNLKELDVVEVLDHHKVDFKTDKPISILVKPIGSTCSILAEKYFEEEIELDKKIAGLLLAGIISDTLFFRSPTTTDVDRKLADKLVEVVGVDDLEALSLEMFNAKSDLGDIEVGDLIKLDYKTFTFKDGDYGIGVMETTNVDYGLDRKDEILNKLVEIKEEDGLKGVYFVIVDILNEKGYALYSGNDEKELFTKLFKAEDQEGVLFVDKLVSRKKQIVPVFENQ
jgi:manganese-dependent inorganic pyrophosphatase